MYQSPIMGRRTVMLPLAGGLSALIEKRIEIAHDLDLSHSATQVGDWNHPAADTLLLDSDAVPHVNNAGDPGSSTLTMTDTAAFNMDRVRGIEHTASFSDFAHVTLDGYTPGGADPGQYEITANETVVVGNVVYVSGNNTVNLGDASALATSHVIGLAYTAGTANDTITVRTDGEVSQADWTAVVGAATLTPGAEYYLSTTAGQMTTTPPSGDGESIVRLGVAITTTKFDIEVNEIAVL